jgi:hypothetical protein
MAFPTRFVSTRDALFITFAYQVRLHVHVQSVFSAASGSTTVKTFHDSASNSPLTSVIRPASIFERSRTALIAEEMIAALLYALQDL